MEHSTRCFIRYPYTSKSVRKNSAARRFSTHFSVSKYQISTQLNRNKAWQILILKSKPTLITTGHRGILKKVIIRWIYTKSILVNCTLLAWRPRSFSRTTSEDLRIRLYFCLKYEFSGWKTTFTLKTPSCFTPSISFLQLPWGLRKQNVKCPLF